MMTTSALTPSHAAAAAPRRYGSPITARLALAVMIAVALAAAFLATNPDTATQAATLAGKDLTRLLRAMAVIKAGMALAVIAAVFWRLGSAITLPRFGAYALVCAAMASGPALIWDMAAVGAGALLLHCGLLAGVVLLWRDPAVSVRLAALVAARRRSLT